MPKTTRAIALFSLLTVLFLAVVVGGAWWRWSGGAIPWASTLSWQQMEGYVETQVIAATDVTLHIQPASQRMEGVATLSLVAPGGSGAEVAVLLNSGFTLDSVTLDGEDLRYDRYRERIRISLPSDKNAGELAFNYTGWPEATNDSTCIVGGGEVLLDKLQCWYPIDLKSFASFSAAITVPETWEVVWGGTLKENKIRDGQRRVVWEETRPVLAVGLAAGAYERRSRVQGSIRCAVYGTDLDDEETDARLAALGDAYNALTTRLGPAHYEVLNLVESASLTSTVHAGGSLLFTGTMSPPDGDHLFVDLARNVAANWWGDTVSGRWFSTRPEAGEWMVSSLSEFSAWQALRTVKGRRSYLRFIETQSCPPQFDVPMKTFNLGQRLRPNGGMNRDVLRVRGAFVAAVLSEYAGPEAFERAARNFMSVHRYTTVSFAAFLHELTLASEQPLDELVRVWFDRPGTFDYRIARVEEDGGRVHVTIENMGDIPAYVPLKLGLVTENGYHTESVQVGGGATSVRIALEGALQRVVLDPEFEVGDMRRANNRWPATEWPTAFVSGANGRIALIRQEEWGEGAPTSVSIFSRMDKSPEYLLYSGLERPSFLAWDLAGLQLSIVSGGFQGIFHQGAWNATESARHQLRGWFGGDLLHWDEAALFGTSEGASAGSLVAVNQESGDVAIARPNGHLVLVNAESGRVTLLAEEIYPAKDLGWRTEEPALVYFERGGDLVSLPLESNLRTVLLHRNYPVSRSRVSPSAQFVAWVDPAGLLRAVDVVSSNPVYLSLPGEVVDFAWEGDAALLALVATIPRRIPMRFHADYGLWRIPVSTWQGTQLPYNPEQFVRSVPKATLQLAE